MSENWFAEIARAITRPAVTIIFTAVIADAVICGRVLPEWYLALAIPCITWWFAERAITHLKNNNNSNVEKIASKVAELIKK